MIDIATNATQRNMFGRTVLYSAASSVGVDNVVSVLKTALEQHIVNKTDILYLYEYYKGYQPILQREKTVRPEICNKIVENHAYEIVSFKTGYEFGEPVQYVRRGEGDDITAAIGQLNEYMMYEDKATRDKELAEWFNICGTAYRKTLPAKSDDDNPFEIETLHPAYTGVVYSNGFKKKPLMAFQEVEVVSSKNPNKTEIIYCVYTDKEYFEITEEKITRYEPHVLGSIPIIEYPANTARLGSFEVVLGLLDTINNSASNRMDGIEQFIQSFVKFVNCDIDETNFAALKEMGAIKIHGEPGNPADVDIITSELNQHSAQIQVDNLYQMVLIIAGMPDRNGATRTTGDTGQAVIMRDGWAAAESRARDTELVFKSSEKQFLKLILRILSEKGLSLSLKDIEIKFARNKTDNLVTKVQGLNLMLTSGIAPQIAINTCGLFSDPEQVYMDSTETLKKWYLQGITNTEVV